MKHATVSCVALTGAVLALAGCRTRTLEINSDPPGALVWLNDEQVGRTPLETDFVFYGEYDVRLHLDGYVPVSTHANAAAPLSEQPGIDFFTQPFPGRSTTQWNFLLQPLPETLDQKGAEEAAYARAKAFRERAIAARGDQPKGAAGTPATVTPSPTSPSTTAPAPTTDK